MVWYGMVLYDMVWYVWYVWHGLVWYGVPVAWHIATGAYQQYSDSRIPFYPL